MLGIIFCSEREQYTVFVRWFKIKIFVKHLDIVEKRFFNILPNERRRKWYIYLLNYSNGSYHSQPVQSHSASNGGWCCYQKHRLPWSEWAQLLHNFRNRGQSTSEEKHRLCCEYNEYNYVKSTSSIAGACTIRSRTELQHLSMSRVLLRLCHNWAYPFDLWWLSLKRVTMSST